MSANGSEEPLEKWQLCALAALRAFRMDFFDAIILQSHFGLHAGEAWVTDLLQLRRWQLCREATKMLYFVGPCGPRWIPLTDVERTRRLLAMIVLRERPSGGGTIAGADDHRARIEEYRKLLADMGCTPHELRHEYLNELWRGLPDVSIDSADGRLRVDVLRAEAGIFLP
jgi:hypothetical protein